MTPAESTSLLIPLEEESLGVGLLWEEARPARGQRHVRADDLGVLRGDGVFEAFLVVDGTPWLLDEHLARLERSAAAVELDVPAADAWRQGLAQAIESWQGGREMVVRLIVTRGPEATGAATAYVLADPVKETLLRQRREGVAVVVLERGMDSKLAERAPWLLMGAKTLSYAVNMAALRWANAHDADDVIFVTSDGAVLEAPTAAVVIARGHSLVSPPTSLGILPSVTLQEVFAAAPAAGWTVRYEQLAVDDLHRADGVWLLSSTRRSARVHTLDGQRLVDSGLDPQMAALASPGTARTELTS